METEHTEHGPKSVSISSCLPIDNWEMENNFRNPMQN